MEDALQCELLRCPPGLSQGFVPPERAAEEGVCGTTRPPQGWLPGDCPSCHLPDICQWAESARRRTCWVFISWRVAGWKPATFLHACPLVFGSIGGSAVTHCRCSWFHPIAGFFRSSSVCSPVTARGVCNPSQTGTSFLVLLVVKRGWRIPSGCLKNSNAGQETKGKKIFCLNTL